MNKLIFRHGSTHRAVITAADGERWNNDAEALELQAHADGDWADYLLTPTQLGTSQDWTYTVPAALPAGDYTIAVYDGAAPAVDADPIGSASFRWTGAAVILGRTDNRDGNQAATDAGLSIAATVAEVIDAFGRVLRLSGDLSDQDKVYNRRLLVITSGDAQHVQARVIGYVGSTQTVTLSSPLPAVPAVGDDVLLVGHVE